MNLDANNIVRTAAATVVGLVIAIPVSVNAIATGAATREALKPGPVQVYMDDIRENLVAACGDYNISPADSKLERQAKTAIDDYFEGDKVNYSKVCTTVFG